MTKTQPGAKPAAKIGSKLGPAQGDFTPTQVQEYQAARDVLAARIRGLLVAADACTTADERKELDETVSELSRQRGALQVGSPEVLQLITDGVATKAVRLPKQR